MQALVLTLLFLAMAGLVANYDTNVATEAHIKIVTRPRATKR